MRAESSQGHAATGQAACIAFSSAAPTPPTPETELTGAHHPDPTRTPISAAHGHPALWVRSVGIFQEFASAMGWTVSPKIAALKSWPRVWRRVFTEVIKLKGSHWGGP